MPRLQFVEHVENVLQGISWMKMYCPIFVTFMDFQIMLDLNWWIDLLLLLLLPLYTTQMSQIGTLLKKNGEVHK